MCQREWGMYAVAGNEMERDLAVVESRERCEVQSLEATGTHMRLQGKRRTIIEVESHE